MEQLNQLTEMGSPTSSVQRRTFLRQLGLFSGSAALLASCTLKDHNLPGSTVNLGAGDIGIANLAFLLDQLETAFYRMAYERSAGGGFTANDRSILAELHDHEVVHREFFKAYLGPNGIPMLDFDFSSINFNDRAIVFGKAKDFEDVGVGAINGAGPLIQSVDLLAIGGKMVSVEARHSTLVRHVLQDKKAYTIGLDLVDQYGRGWYLTPDEVVARVQPFVKQQINAGNLPKY